MHDLEVSIQDADIETADLHHAANAMSRLRKKGICFHNWSGPVVFGEPATQCRDCGKVFPSWDAMSAERDDLKAEYL
jgi:hypothetical protein